MIILRQFFIRLSLISLVKLIGALGKIPLYRMVGAEGIGLYQVAYSYYGLVLTIITLGLPTALSLISSQDPVKRQALLKRSAIILLFTGSLMGLITFQYAPFIVSLYGDSHLLWAIRAVSPALVVVPMLSLLRGYLQGLEYYRLIAVSEVVEQIIRISVMLLCVSVWLHFGIDFAISGATLAAAISAIFTLIFLLYFLHKTTQEHVFTVQPSPSSSTFYRSSFIILISQLIVPTADLITTLIIPLRLSETNMSIHQALAVFGQYFGMGSMIIYIPTLMTSALSHILIIKFCSEWEKGKVISLTKKMKRAIQFVTTWGIFSSFFLMYFSKEISILVVGDDSIYFCIFYLSLAPLFSGLHTITTTSLWATGNQKGPLIGLTVGSITSLLLYFFLIPIQGLQFVGIILGFLATDLICVIWNLFLLQKKFQLLSR